MAKGLFTKSGFIRRSIRFSTSRELHPCAVLAQPYPLPATLERSDYGDKEYHYVFCASSPTSCCACFPESVLIARQSGAGKSRREWRHGAPAAWLDAKGTYLICPMLRRRYLASLSFSRYKRQKYTKRKGEEHFAFISLS